MKQGRQYIWIGAGAVLGGFLVGIYRLAPSSLSGVVGGLLGGLLGAGAYALLRRPWRPVYRWSAALGLLVLGFGVLWLLGGAAFVVQRLAEAALGQYHGQ
ncbi:MAG: hypothetical protein HY320_04640 [Armatimonadetes bacterium]|nr:hypothetical protein [Armatimonadota bacterium]